MKYPFCRTCLNLEYDPFACRTCQDGSEYENNGEDDDYDEDLRALQALDKGEEEPDTIWLELEAA